MRDERLTVSSNATAFNASASDDAPQDFDIEFSITHDYGPRLNEIALYMTTVVSLEDLCFRDQSSTVPGDPGVPFTSPTTWSLPQYNVIIEISSQQVRYAIWGLQLITGNARKVGFWPTIGRFFWRGQFAGRVDIANKNNPLPPSEDSLESDVKHGNVTEVAVTRPTRTAASSDILSNSTAAFEFVDGARLTIVPTYNGLQLSPRAVFGAAINAMVFGAENGPDTYCTHLQRSEVEIIGLTDARGEPLLKYKSVIRAMGMLTSWMVAIDRFGEIDVQIRRDATLVGTARIKKRAGSVSTE